MPEIKLFRLKVREWSSPEKSRTLGKLGQIRSQIAFLPKKYFIQTKPPKLTNFLHQMLDAKSKEVHILISRSIQWPLTDQPSDNMGKCIFLKIGICRHSARWCAQYRTSHLKENSQTERQTWTGSNALMCTALRRLTISNKSDHFRIGSDSVSSLYEMLQLSKVLKTFYKKQACYYPDNKTCTEMNK